MRRKGQDWGRGGRQKQPSVWFTKAKITSLLQNSVAISLTRDGSPQQASKGALHTAGGTQTQLNTGVQRRSHPVNIQVPQEPGTKLFGTGVAKPVSNEGKSRHSSLNPEGIWTNKVPKGICTICVWKHHSVVKQWWSPSYLQVRPEDM